MMSFLTSQSGCGRLPTSVVGISTFMAVPFERCPRHPEAMAELAMLTGSPLLLGRDLQEQRLGRDLHRGHRDAILVGEIADRLDVGVAGVEVDVRVGDGRDRLDADA